MSIQHNGSYHTEPAMPAYTGNVKPALSYEFDVKNKEGEKRLNVILIYNLIANESHEAFEVMRLISEYNISGNVTMIDLYRVILFSANNIRVCLAAADNIPSPLKEVRGQSPESMQDDLIPILEALNS